jgi:carbon-monoxide dehydrogenase large subunit
MREAPQTSDMVGRTVRRVEDRNLLSGTATFLDDVPLPDALHVAYVRSQLAHGIVTSVRADDARATAGVVGVFTGADLVDIAPLITPVANAINPPRPLLASERVRYVGEPIAVVVATSPYIAEDAAALVDIDIDPLPVIRSLSDAVDPTRPVLHATPEVDTNVLFDRTLEVGDPDSAFSRASHIVERVFKHPRLVPAPMETRGAAAYLEDGELVLWASTQFPHALKEVVATLLGHERVRVKCPDIGGGFGLKSVSSPEEILVAWLALELGQPVKWVEDRSENLIASAHARHMEVTVRAAADDRGTLLALDIDVLGDAGAYSVYPITHVLETAGVMSMTPGPYRLENYRARGRAVATNTCPAGPYRGVGLPVSTLVHERIMDILAGEVGITPTEVRRRNLITSRELPYMTVTGQNYDSGDYPAALAMAAEMIGYQDFEAEQQVARASGELVGVGFASYVEWTGNNSTLFKQRGMSAMKGWDSCQLSLGRDGRVSVWTSSPSIGQGTATTYAQVLADATGIDFADIDVIQSDTGSGDVDGTGTGSSRSANVTSGAIVRAGAELKKRLLDDAESRLEASRHDLVIAGSVIRVDGTDVSMSVTTLAADAEEGRYALGRTHEADDVLFAYATHACRVVIDPDTGEVRILDYVVAEDCGRVINPMVVEGQTRGAVAQGIAAALYESFQYDAEAQPQTGSFMDYLIPTAAELPNVRIHHLEIPAPLGVLGAKGMGEGGTVAAGAVVANAVSNALGAEYNSLPLRPETLQARARELLSMSTNERGAVWK